MKQQTCLTTVSINLTYHIIVVVKEGATILLTRSMLVPKG